MKPPVCKLLALALAVVCCLQAASADPAGGSDTPPPLDASPTPATAGNTPPDAAAKSVKKPKAPRDPNAPPKPPKVKKVKEIPFPLPLGDTAKMLQIPENSVTGQLISQVMAMKAKRISNELVEMEEMKMDLNHPDGKTDFHIFLPASVFNLQTHMITSEQPVTVRTDDFELTGEKMEFNTVDRTGKLVGHVHMHIHNLKQVAGPQQPPTP